jgi:hypothetical protein
MKKFSFLFLILTFWSCNPSKEDSLSWDFSEPKAYNYSFTQSVKSENKVSDTSKAIIQSAKAQGTLEVKSTSNALANLTLKNVGMKSISYDEAGNAIEGPSTPIPNKVVKGMKENGTYVNPLPDLLFKLVLALPTKELKEGESEKIPLEMPLNTGDVNLVSKGYHTLTFSGFENWNNRKCAVIKGKIDISDMDVPSEKEYLYSNIGETTHYFDLENRVYIGSDIKMAITIRVNDLNEQGMGTYLNLNSENRIELKLKDS